MTLQTNSKTCYIHFWWRADILLYYSEHFSAQNEESLPSYPKESLFYINNHKHHQDSACGNAKIRQNRTTTMCDDIAPL